MLVQGYTTQRKDPYASLDDARMRRAIAETKPKRAPGGKVAYSNYGYGLLGYALAHRAGTSYAELLHARVTGPLGLAHTALDTPGLTQGHGVLGRAAHSWDLASLAGAGGLRSTARDMLAYLAIHTGTARSAKSRATPASSARASASSASAWGGSSCPPTAGRRGCASSTRR